MKHTTHTSHRRTPVHARPPAGFTLVEMLVAVALVILMLMLFAQIFGDTVRIMREQQALAQNDQKARGVETILRNDFARMTFRQPRVKGVTGLVPLRAGWPVDPDRQRGYFYISENDVENGSDDVIQFTIDGRQTHRAPEVQMYKGRAATLAANTFSPGAAILDVNQPDWDDGAFDDNLGESHSAEVVYFLRGGNLYRRQLLLREPITPSASGAPSEFDPQPGPGPVGAVLTSGLYTRKFVRNLAGSPVSGDYSADLDVSLTPGLADFWHDFDYSAWNWWRDNNNNGFMDNFSDGVDQYWLMFNGVDSLKNVPGATNFPIAVPQYRFGHLPPHPVAANVGKPLEYLPGAGTSQAAFIGRFTHEETSSVDNIPATSTISFGYPGVVPEDDGEAPALGVAFNPFLATYPANWDANANGVVDAYEGGPRAGEDLILANVESFDIEVWDDGLVPAGWVDLGHVGGGGNYAHAQNWNPSYGPRAISLGPDNQPGIAGYDDDGLADAMGNFIDTSGERGWPYSDDGWNRVFDTWHPNATAGTPSTLTANSTAVFEPPFRPLRVTTGVPWQADSAVTDDSIIFPGHEDRDYDGALDPSEDTNGNGLLDTGEDTNGNGVLDGLEDRNGNTTIDSDLSYYYQPVGMVDASNPMTTGTKEPEWPREPGATVVDGNVIWQCFDNRIGLQMVRLTVRYRDPASGAPRQVSIVHSFVE